MFEVKESEGLSRCEEVCYACQCDRLSSWYYSGHHPGRALRQPYEMKTRQRWILLIFLVSAVTVILLMAFTSSKGGSRPKLHINLDELTERGKCPACFGVNLCPQMISGKIELSEWTKFSITKLVNQKNIYFAEMMENGKMQKLILKKLAHDHELDELDKAICERHGKHFTDGQSCDVSDSVRNLITEYSHHSELQAGEPSLHGAKIGPGSDILLCPSHRKMDFLVKAAQKFNRGQHKSTILANFLTTILLNPEPVLLQAFPSSEGWPFPKYYGACGRIIAEEHVGKMLTQCIDEPFKTRANYAKQLLEMANKFGENGENFILYLGDPSPDNFAVNEKDLKVKLIDLENIIVVDKEELIKSKVEDANKLLVSQSMKCENEKGNKDGICFSFSTDDLCQRPLNDHNYYAVCAGLLAPGALAYEFPSGLLHSIPQDTKLAKLSSLIQQCKDPTAPESSLQLTRVEAAQQIIQVLGDYLKAD